MFRKKVKLITHDGTFHADDIFATACLNLYFRKQNRKTKVIRTRDPKIIQSADATLDIVYDVGGEYDPAQNKYDHHQKNAPANREDGIPYSAFGLIWKNYGLKMVKTEKIHQEIDHDFVEQICASDTGAVDFKIPGYDWNLWVFDPVVGLFQADDIQSKEQYKNFNKIVKIAELILEKVIVKAEKRAADEIELEKIYNNTKDKRIIVLERGDLSWKRYLAQKPEPIYVIYPTSDKKSHHVQAVSKEKSSRESRKKLPAEWGGLSEIELEKIIEINGVKFVHKAGFLAVVDNLENALKIAHKSLEN